MTLLTRLTSVEEFSTADAPALDWLSGRAHVFAVRRGKSVIRSSDFIHLVLRGRLHVLCNAGCTRKMIVDDVGPMQLVGHIEAMAGVDDDGVDDGSLLSIRAAEDSELARISATDFQSLVMLFPRIAKKVMSKISESHISLSNRVAELALFPAKARLYIYVLRLTEDSRDEYVLAPSHEVIAAHICSHREAVTRELRKLKRLGLLSYTRGTIRIRDWLGLYDLVRDSTGGALSLAELGLHEGQYDKAASAEREMA